MTYDATEITYGLSESTTLIFGLDHVPAGVRAACVRVLIRIFDAISIIQFKEAVTRIALANDVFSRSLCNRSGHITPPAEAP